MFRRLAQIVVVLSLMPAFAAPPPGLIQVTGIRSWSHADATRVILEMTGPAQYKTDRAINPDRIFFDIQHARPLIASHAYATHPVNDALVRRVRIAETEPGTTRIVFDLTEPASYVVTRLEAPDRMVIELRPLRQSTVVAVRPGIQLTPPSRPTRSAVYAGPPPPLDPGPLGTAPAPDLVKLPRQTRSLRAPATTSSTSLPPVPAPSASAPSASTKVLPARQSVAVAGAPRAPENASRSLTRTLGLKVNRIVIDAGHGGHDDGTIGPHGVMEKDVVLDVALRLAALVQSRLGAEVVLTRSDDTFIPLHERTDIANDHKADLFLSIHANSSPAPAVAGTETFFLNFTNNPTALDVASRENAGSDKSVGELKDLIQTITLNDKIAESETFAQTVQTAIFGQAAKSNVAARNRGVKRAPFVVLIGASMPSVLAEIGFLSNAKDEANLGKPEYRQRIAEALYKGLAQYSQSLSHFEMASGRVQKSAEKPAGVGLN